ncbi:hypothetical protein [Bacteroides acidifaciens]
MNAGCEDYGINELMRKAVNYTYKPVEGPGNILRTVAAENIEQPL